MNARLSSLAGASLCALALATPAVADAPAGYYDSLEGKTGVALKKAVKAIRQGDSEETYGDFVWRRYLERFP